MQHANSISLGLLLIAGSMGWSGCRERPSPIPVARAAAHAAALSDARSIQTDARDVASLRNQLGPVSTSARLEADDATAAPLGGAAPADPGLELEQDPGLDAKPTTALPAQAPVKLSACYDQTPQAFLVAAHFDAHAAQNPGRAREFDELLKRAIRYRTEHYGYFEGFGSKQWNPRPPGAYAKITTFFGVPVSLHEKVVPALACVEQAILDQCAQFEYRPTVLSGIRKRNTYFNGEVSNHVYGIALDVDPSLNPCCGCLEPWRSNPRCAAGKDKFERMAMPRCWVTQFERFGFHWLGHAPMEDTMHFEFLGDPTQVSRSASSVDAAHKTVHGLAE